MTALEEVEALVASFGSDETGYSVQPELIPIIQSLQLVIQALKELQ